MRRNLVLWAQRIGRLDDPHLLRQLAHLLAQQIEFLLLAPHRAVELVEQVFGVKVDSVHTMNRKGKARRTRFGIGKRKDTKRAIVTLREGTIDIFGGPVG